MKQRWTLPRWDYFNLLLIWDGIRRWLRREPSVFGEEIHRAAIQHAMAKDAKKYRRKR